MFFCGGAFQVLVLHREDPFLVGSLLLRKRRVLANKETCTTARKIKTILSAQYMNKFFPFLSGIPTI
jgi:hypothetical protein